MALLLDLFSTLERALADIEPLDVQPPLSCYRTNSLATRVNQSRDGQRLMQKLLKVIGSFF